MGKKALALAVVVALGIATELSAQQGGGGFGGGGFNRDGKGGPTIDWFPSMDSVVDGGSGGGPEGGGGKRFRFGMERGEKKYIFVYVQALGSKDPNEFQNIDLVQASRMEWAFVKMDFDKEHPYQKSWGLKGAPVCMACDIHGNDFGRAANMSIDGLRNLIRNTPELIMRFEMKLRSDYQKAVESLKTDEAKGVKGLMDVASTGKVGYPEIKEAQSKLIEAADSSFRNCELAEAVGPDYGIDYLEDLVKVYKATAPGVRAEVRIARLERARENVQAAIARLQKVLKYDARLLRSELDDANRVLGEISQDGEAKIQAALAAGKSAGTKELLKKLAKDYAGTEAGKHAADEAK